MTAVNTHNIQLDTPQRTEHSKCWQALEELRAGVAGEVEATHKQLSGVRAELAPWEAKIAAAKSRLNVATAERDLLLKQGADAQQRLKVPPRDLQ